MGLLSRKECRVIPRSTLSDWRKRDMADIIGFDPDEIFMVHASMFQQVANHPMLISMNEALLKVIQFYSSILENVRGYKKLWKKSRETIVALIQEIQPEVGLEKACEFLHISSQKFHRWKRSVGCLTSRKGLCRKLHPNQLTMAEEKVIETYVKKEEHRYKHLSGIYYRMMNDGAAFMGIDTFREHAKKFREAYPVIRKQKRKIGIRATAPLKILHMDTTIVRTLDGTKIYIHFIVDNFSRVILGWKASLDATSLNPAQNLLEVSEKHNLFSKELDLLCDDGSENQGEVSVFLARNDVLIKRLIAQIDILFSNSMVEAANKIMKYHHLFPRKPRNYEHVIQILSEAVPEYNNGYLSEFYGLTRNDVLAGKIPDRHLFAERIRMAKEARPSVNRVELCGVC